MINKAFKLVCDNVEKSLTGQGFTKQKVDSQKSNEMVALFTSDALAYSVIYYKDSTKMVLRSCAMTDEGPDNEWKSVATWAFDPDVDTEREAQSIANDFCDAVSAPAALKKMKSAKKKKANKEDGNADPLFLAKRFATLYPDIKTAIVDEENNHSAFRAVTFTKKFIVPKVQSSVKSGSKNEIEKIGKLLSAQYANGDMDTRSVITIVILNSLDEQYHDVVNEYLSDDLKKAFKNALKYKGKNVKPEKRKKKRMSIANTLKD